MGGLDAAAIRKLLAEALELRDAILANICRVALGNREPGQDAPWPVSREEALEECTRLLDPPCVWCCTVIPGTDAPCPGCGATPNRDDSPF